jgi:predicted permease
MGPRDIYLDRLRQALRAHGVVDPAILDEILGHLDDAVDSGVAVGLSREAAEEQACARFGDPDLVAGQYARDQRGTASGRPGRTAWLKDFGSDVRLGIRHLRRAPLFAAVAILTLGLGTGAAAAIFTLVDAVLIRSLPVRDPDRLVVIDMLDFRGRQTNASYPNFLRLQADHRFFAGVLAAQDGTEAVSGRVGELGPRETTEVQFVSGEYFHVLGTVPADGRLFTPDDNRVPGGHPVAVLSDAYRKRRFGGVPAVGREIWLNEQRFTVIGVTRAGFFGESVGRMPDVWIPLMMQPAVAGRSLIDQPRVGWLRLMGRLADGASIEPAAAALGTSVRLTDGRGGLDVLRDKFAIVLRALSGVVVILLVVAFANVASLLLGRLAVRQREIGLRTALGAGRGRLVRQFLAEHLVLASLGGLVGVWIGWLGSRALLDLASTGGSAIAIDVTPTFRTLTFIGALSLISVAACAFAPSMLAARSVVISAMRPGLSMRVRPRLSASLLIAQVALSVVLIVGTALFVQTVRNLRSRDVGFDASHIVQVRIQPGPGPASAPHDVDLMRRITESLAALPGIRGVATSRSGYGTGISRSCCLAVEHYAHASGEDREMRTMSVLPGYFGAIGTPLVAGRDFRQDEVVTDPNLASAVIVNRAFAVRYFGTHDVVGRRLGWGDPPSVAYDLRIVGVADDAVYDSVREPARPLIFLPHAGGRDLMVRTAGPPETMITAVRHTIAAVDASAEILDLSTIRADIERALVRERVLAQLVTVFGLLAVALTGIGLYGAMAQSVTGRRRQIGIRIALGATRGAILSEELFQTAKLVGAGLIVGIPAALAAAGLVASQLFQVSAGDSVVMLFAAVFISLVSFVAAYAPARRAAHIDPVVALRAE